MPILPDVLEKHDEGYEDIVDSNLPQIVFTERQLSETTTKRLEPFFKEVTKEFGLTDYQIAGGFAVAVGNFESWEFDVHAWHDEVENRYGDIDIYVSPSDFTRLMKSGKYPDFKPNIINHVLTSYFKTKVQIVCKQKFTIQEIVSSFDFNITGFYIDVVFNQNPVLYRDSELNNFDELFVRRVVKNGSQTTFDRIEKYLNRYDSIGSIKFENPQLFIDALEKYRKINTVTQPLKKAKKSLDDILEF